MLAKPVSLMAAAALLWTATAFAQPPSPPGSTVTSDKHTPPPSGKSGAASASDAKTPPDAAKATSEIGRFGNFVGSPSTGSDTSSPSPVPGSPPTAPR